MGMVFPTSRVIFAAQTREIRGKSARQIPAFPALFL